MPLVKPVPYESEFPNGLSPVQDFTFRTAENRQTTVYLKREDLWFRGEAHGSKCKVGFKLVGDKPLAVVGGSHRTSPQAERVALIGRELGVPAHVHTAASAEESPIIKRCRELGAVVHEHRPGYMNVVLKRAADQAGENGFALIPWGMECDTYVEEVAKQVKNIPNDVKRIVVPLGSGMALSGILRGLAAQGRALPILAVSVGSKNYAPRVDKYAPKDWSARVKIVDSPIPFDTMLDVSVGPVSLDPQYEAKCAEHLQNGDLLWLVAHRLHPRLRQ